MQGCDFVFFWREIQQNAQKGIIQEKRAEYGMYPARGLSG
jgi:hypothetical protein